MDEARKVESDYERSTPDGGFGTTSSDGQESHSSPGAGGNVTSMMDKAKDQLEPTVDKAKKQLDDGVDKAKDQVDAGIDKAASGLESTAETIKGMTGEGKGMPAQAGVKVAESMETAAAYLKEHSSDEIFKDLEVYVKEHPTQALVGAIFAGFLVGRMMH